MRYDINGFYIFFIRRQNSLGFENYFEKIMEKLHLTILNYTSYYTFHHKFFKYTFCTLNYDSCYTLQVDVKFAVNFDGNPKFMVQSVIKNIVLGGKA